MSFTSDFHKISDLEKSKKKALVSFIGIRSFLEKKEYDEYEAFSLENNVEIDVSSALFRVIAYVTDSIIDEMSISAGFRTVEKITNILSKDKFKSTWKEIEEYFENFDNYIIGRKEKKLLSLNDTLKEIQIICDKRPVFDLEKKQIAKFIYPAIFHLKIENDNSIQFDLTEQDLLLLRREIDSALTKLKVLKNE